MASPSGSGKTVGNVRTRIPFYRNVKVLGFLAQLVFVLILLIGAAILFNNVTSALKKSNLPANFTFLDDRAGIPIAESAIRYETDNTYLRAWVIGFLNTLKVALVGVTLASLLGILLGVMRLSNNWLIRQLATVYVETVRNIPLAVQIVFWFTAVFTPIPPRILNPVELAGGVLFSNQGIALPWLYPSYRFAAWQPWLLVALLVFLGLFLWRRRQIWLSDRPGNPWLFPLVAGLVLASLGYGVVERSGNTLPEGIAADFLTDRGRGTVYLDEDGDGNMDASERFLPYTSLTVVIPKGQLDATTQNLTESRRDVNGTFRFPQIEEQEAERIEVTFASPEDETRYGIHFLRSPSVGLVYEDRNDNGSFDPGEELADPADPAQKGFSGVKLVMSVEGFERTLVADRDGGFRVPRFEVPGSTEQADGGSATPFSVFRPSVSPSEVEGIEAEFIFNVTGPLVLSRPEIPVSEYVGGIRLTTSYLALLIALVIYTASFIAEIVRAGIQAVPKGQSEAAKSLGLSDGHTFRLIIFPQALRIILPPMISQYLNLTKNSSLAPLAAYGELFVITSIIANQTGASIPAATMLIVSYLLISLTFAFVLNIVNERFALVER
jgi:general L-amino acid transport system permease protein